VAACHPASVMPTPPAPIPRTFLEYLRSLGPGMVVALTWLGAGDLVDAAVAGRDYGYALMWALALALLVRWAFVSTIAKYQLCNPRGETVLEGLGRLHPYFPPFLCLATLLFAHGVGVYLYQGLGESLHALFGGPPAGWAIAWAIVSFVLVFRPVWRRIEWVFMGFLGLLGVSLITAALWAGPDWGGVLRGTFGFAVPPQRGSFTALVVVVSLIGAVGGSLANLMYPYLMREKGWTTPAHRRLQLYDLAFGVLAMIVLDLAVWVLAAQEFRGASLATAMDLGDLLTHRLGPWGGTLIYLGIFAACATTVVGNGLAFSYLATDAFLVWRAPASERRAGDYRTHPLYRACVVWILCSPLAWVVGGRTSFVQVTVMINALQVLILPVLAGGLWCLTGSEVFIGKEHRNGLWENALLAVLFMLAVIGAGRMAMTLLPGLGG